MRECREPGTSHPIAIVPAGVRLIVRAGGQILIDTRDALRLQEANYPPVFYFPRGAARMDLLTRTDHSSHCPYKGDASYFTAPGARGENAVWSYESPCPAVAAIRDHLAFYPDRIDGIEVAA